MDEEKEGRNRGVYNNMPDSDIRPDFSTFEDEDNSAGQSTNADNAGPGLAKNFLKDKEQSAARGAVEKIASVAGGAEGKMIAKGINAVEKKAEASGSAKLSPASKGGGSSILKLSKIKAPSIVLILLIVIFVVAVASFFGQSGAIFSYVNNSKEKNNSTKISNTTRTDAVVDQQLAKSSGSKDDPEATLFADIGFSDLQIESFKQGGLGYEESDDGTKAFSFTPSNGKKHVVVANNALSQYTGDGEVAQGDAATTDSGSSAATEEEAKAAILLALGEDPDTVVMTFSQAMADPEFKQKYTAGTKYYRGDTSGWFTETTDIAVQRMGISRNNYEDFELSLDNQKNMDTVLELAKERPSASDAGDLGKLSLEERAKNAASDSTKKDSGLAAGYNAVESVIAADTTLRQTSAASLVLEAADKTMAGEGNEAPLTAVGNVMVQSGAFTSDGMAALFGNGVLEQSSEMVQEVSAQAHGNDSSIIDNENFDSEEYRGSFFVGNYNDKDGAGATPIVESGINKISDWVSKVVDSASSFLKSILPDEFSNYLPQTDSDKVVSALSDTINDYNNMAGKTYFNGDDTKVLGEAIVSGSEKIMNEKAKSAGQVIGDEATLLASYRAQQEVIAEEAEYERNTKSPFDTSSKYTFFGSIANSLVPFATSTQAAALTSTVSNVGSLISNSLTKLLPITDAISEAQVARGDCVYSNNIGAVSNPHCNNYYNSDLELAAGNAMDLYKRVLNMRSGRLYTYKQFDEVDGEVRPHDPKAPDYGNSDLNSAENNQCVTKWVTYNGRRRPAEWSYYVYPNFEYVGYKTGWPNRTSVGTTAAREPAKNDIEPTKCELDLAMDDKKQPIINQNGPLGMFILLSGQRGSEWGVADDANIEQLSTSDFTQGRIHPCLVESSPRSSDSICQSSYYTEKKWSIDADLLAKLFGDDSPSGVKEQLKESVARSDFLSRWAGGSAFVAYNGNENGGSFGSMNTGFSSDERFKDPSRNGDYFWNEIKLYQAYSELLEWLESSGVVNQSGVAKTALRYYDENPMDNTYEGKIARLSGMSREQVVAVLDLFDYVAWLNQYDATALYPMPVEQPEVIQYDNAEIVAQAEKVIQMAGVVYDEMRNRTVAV